MAASPHLALLATALGLVGCGDCFDYDRGPDVWRTCAERCNPNIVSWYGRNNCESDPRMGPLGVIQCVCDRSKERVSAECHPATCEDRALAPLDDIVNEDGLDSRRTL